MGKSFLRFNKKFKFKNKLNNKIFAVQHSYISSTNKNFFDFNNLDFNCNYLLSSGSILFNKVNKLFPSTINIDAQKKMILKLSKS